MNQMRSAIEVGLERLFDPSLREGERLVAALEAGNIHMNPGVPQTGTSSIYSIGKNNIPQSAIGQWQQWKKIAIDRGASKEEAEEHYLPKFMDFYGGDEQQARRILGWVE
jgi:hypothetical protein